MLDQLLDTYPVMNALELDLRRKGFLTSAQDRIPRICRVPASPGKDEAARPNERFGLIAALGLLDEAPYQRQLLLDWAHRRLSYNGRLLVSSQGGREGLRNTYRRLRLRHEVPHLSASAAEDLLADAGFTVIELDVAHRWDPLSTPSLVIVAIRS